MTASLLLSSLTSLEESSLELESILDAKIFAVPVGALEELLRCLSHPTELIIEYERAPAWNFLSASGLPRVRSYLIAEMPPSEDFNKVLALMDYFWKTFGPVFSDLAWLSSNDEFRRQAAAKDRFAKELEDQGLVNPKLLRSSYGCSDRLDEAASCRRRLATLLEAVEIPPETTLSPFERVVSHASLRSDP